MRYAAAVLLGLALGLASGGCPAPDGAENDSVRLAVNDTLRAACQPMTDEAIAGIIVYYEQWRSLHVPYDDELGYALTGCMGYQATGMLLEGVPPSYTCNDCAVAILNQVYGVE